MRDGLTPYSLAGPLGRFLDADRDVLLDSDFVTFELETLMGMGPKVTIPVLTYLFHRIEQRLDGRPTLIIIDEAWVVLANATFGAKLEEWLRTLRKKNAAVVLATQSLSEIANSPYRDVILESCPTKLYLPNAEARNPQTRELYRKFGLSDRQIDIIAEAAPKRDYYYALAAGAAALPVRAGTGGAGLHRRRFEGGRACGAADDRRVRRTLARRVAPRSRPSVNGRTTSIGLMPSPEAALDR